MGKMKKIATSIILLICLTLVPFGVTASSDISRNNNKKFRQESTQILNKNILYSEENQTITTPVYKSYAEYSCFSKNQIFPIVKDYCLNREESFTINYTGNFEDLRNIIPEIRDYIQKSDDYLANSIKSYSGRWQGYDGNISLQLNMEYRTTKDQENFVDSKVDSILSSIITPSMTQDKKEKAIHDYIVSHVVYDRSLTKFTAYEALYSGETVCQGYAMLAYKMLNKVGVETRIVVGQANNGSSTENHAWNLVNLNGKWYQMDCTWDDPIPDVKGRVLYDYYNLTDAQIGQNHFWNKADYPEAYTIYDMGSINNPNEENQLDLSGFKQIDEKKDVVLNKMWNIDFTKGVDLSSVNENNVFIVEESEFKNKFTNIENINNESYVNNVNKLSRTVGYNADKKLLTITPTNNYESGKSYYIIITQNVLSIYKEKIPKPVIMKFIVQ
ncbi:transglutaminase domain-containing protein [Clostridium lundense]|uniref:transglutaminase domain-containing protein n=1 Tax=Clostridium lundense TaxID=319475 RepID=UPI00068748BB|nr:transglutaminase domain-containing protein [Clostridium lundense]